MTVATVDDYIEETLITLRKLRTMLHKVKMEMMKLDRDMEERMNQLTAACYPFPNLEKTIREKLERQGYPEKEIARLVHKGKHLFYWLLEDPI